MNDVEDAGQNRQKAPSEPVAEKDGERKAGEVAEQREDRDSEIACSNKLEHERHHQWWEWKAADIRPGRDHRAMILQPGQAVQGQEECREALAARDLPADLPVVFCVNSRYRHV